MAAADATYGTYGGRSFTDPPLFGQQGPRPSNGEGPRPGEPRPGDSPSSEGHSILRSGGLKGALRGSRINVWELILVPWALLILILLCYLIGGAHGKTEVLWIMPIVLVGLSVLFARHHYKQGNSSEVVLGILCTTAVLIGLVVGVYSVVKSLNEFHRLSQGASYANVLPQEPARGHSDATTLVFIKQAMVDQQRTFGFVDARTPAETVYCVAPVMTGKEGWRPRIQYWAAGRDCCESRGNFKCGQADDAAAHGAIVLPEDIQKLPGFAQAVRGAEAAYGITPGLGYILVQWHKDPVGFRNGLWHGVVTLYLIFAGVYLVISSMIGCALMPVVTVK